MSSDQRSPGPWPYVVLGVLSAVLDLWSKAAIFASIPLGEERPVMGRFLLFRPHYNDAGPWSFGFGLPLELRRWILPSLGLLAIAAIVWILVQTPRRERLRLTGFTLILGGAVGNLYDRVTAVLVEGFHGVRDFIYFPDIVFGKPFPAFNLADTWITVGVVLVAWCILLEGPEEAPAAAGDAATGAAPAKGGS